MSSTSVPSVPQPARPGGRTWGSALVALLFKSFKLLKLAKFAAVGATLASYGWLFGWRFGLVFTAYLLFHEWGHVRAARLVGVEPKGIWLIPFMAGLTFVTPPETRMQEAVIALGGPVFGSVAMLAVGSVWALSGERDWAAYATFIALINLIQLLPFGMLDGGRLIKAIAASVHTTLGTGLYVLGMLAGAIVVIGLRSYVLGALLVLAVIETFVIMRRGGFGDLPGMSKPGTAAALVSYLALILLHVGVIIGLASVPGANLGALLLQD
jgi:membrane-associated protease RseP (regulator of RpoE activity)